MMRGMPMTTYRSSDAELDAYLAVPSTPGPWPGVVVIHDSLGFQGDVVAQADRLASHGYLAFAPALYSAGTSPICVVTTAIDAMRGSGATFIHLDAARQVLLDHPECTGRVGVIGFCRGGDFAVLAAPRGFDAASVNYGIVPRDAVKVLRGSCPVVASYGGKDRYLPGAARKLDEALTKIGVDHDVVEYPKVGHSFLNELPGIALSRLNPINALLGLHHRDDASAADARQRILAFFDEHLKRASAHP